jgi:putative ABC transport system permease protein
VSGPTQGEVSPGAGLPFLCRALLAVAGRLAPAVRRGDWRREWEAELWHRRRHLERLDRGRPRVVLDLARRCLGALPHAATLRALDWGLHMLGGDLRRAVSTLTATPTLTAVVVLVLSLGIGADVLVFSLVDALLLRPFDFPRAERLVAIDGTLKAQGIERGKISWPDYRDLAGSTSSFAATAAWGWNAFALDGDRDGEPTRLLGARVSAGFFSRVLAAEPLLGRTFQAADDRPGSPCVAVVSEDLWRSRFGADPGAVGRPLHLDGEPCTLVGVMRRGSELPDRARLWVPLALGDDAPRGRRIYAAVGRLADGTDLAAAQAEMSALAARLAADHPDTNHGVGMAARTLREMRVGRLGRVSLLLLAAVALLLALVCANVAHLLLARGAARRHEMAVRTSLGASRGRLLRPLLLESLLLAAAGGVGGLLLGRWGLAALAALAPVEMPPWVRFGADLRIVLFTVAVSAAAAVAFGLAPALDLSRSGLAGGLAALAGGRAQRRRRRSLAPALGTRNALGRRRRDGLLVAELALSLVLLAVAALLLQSLRRLADVDPGFDAVHTAAVTVHLPEASYTEAAPVLDFADRLQRRAAALPGVEAAGLITRLPLLGPNYTGVRPRGQTVEAARDNPLAVYNAVSPGLFRALGVPLLAGRDLVAGDVDGAAKVAVVSRSFARRFFPGETAVGQRFRSGGDVDDDEPAGWVEVVGLVGDVRHDALDGELAPQVYFPLAQEPDRDLSLVVRGTGAPAPLLPQLRDAVRRLDPALAVDDVTTLAALVDRHLAYHRFLVVPLWIFAVVGLLLAAVGVYGVTSFLVARRRDEIGLRMALGATRGRVVRGVVTQGLRTVAAGLAVGLAGAWVAGRAVAGFLYATPPFEATTVSAVAALLIAVSLLALYLPARRAAGTDPLTALRGS